MTRKEALTSLRSTLEWLGDDVTVLSAPVDPEIEATAIAKGFDEGPVIVSDQVKGYPDARMISGMWGRRDRMARLFGVDSFAECKIRLIEAIKNPIAPRVVDRAPCQEVVIPREAVRPFSLFPMVRHTHLDGGRFFGSGVHLLGGRWADGGNQLAFYRMSFRGNDFASIQMIPGGHGDQITERHSKERIPCTINICPPPMVELMGMGQLNAIVFPTVDDELGAAGALGGAPIDIVKAKTVDAYAVANAEWVIEGHIVPYERVWETEEAERLGRQGEAMLHPEWARYMGRAYRARKFEVTAVTHRADRPYYYVPYFGTIWYAAVFGGANFYELAERIAPGFVQDVGSYTSLLTRGGYVFKVKKRRRSDEGMQRNILAAAMGVSRGLRLAIAVDDDIDIEQPEDVLWALATRVNYHTDLIVGPRGAKGQAFQPGERVTATQAVSMFDGGLAIDATVPLGAAEHFARARYPVEEVDFSRWFSDAEIRAIRAGQSEYIRFMGETGLS